jgi:lauroyl/myristoyl acyltransferase
MIASENISKMFPKACTKRMIKMQIETLLRLFVNSGYLWMITPLHITTRTNIQVPI